MKIVSKRIVNEKTKVYDVTVPECHHYGLKNGLISHNSYVPGNQISGGGGLVYAASTIAELSKKKVKIGDEIVGNIVRVKMMKSRLSRENKVVDVLLTYDRGLDRYYGLLALAEKYKIINKVSTKYEFPDGSKAFEKHINADPEKYFTKEIMERLEAAARREFMYGLEAEEEPGDLPLAEAVDEEEAA